MNVRMWQHEATQRNLSQLIADGVSIIGPEEGLSLIHISEPTRPY